MINPFAQTKTEGAGHQFLGAGAASRIDQHDLQTRRRFCRQAFTGFSRSFIQTINRLEFHARSHEFTRNHRESYDK
jgi:hypothetical protein